jgi:hypothetical protein
MFSFAASLPSKCYTAQFCQTFGSSIFDWDFLFIEQASEVMTCPYVSYNGVMALTRMRE